MSPRRRHLAAWALALAACAGAVAARVLVGEPQPVTLASLPAQPAAPAHVRTVTRMRTVVVTTPSAPRRVRTVRRPAARPAPVRAPATPAKPKAAAPRRRATARPRSAPSTQNAEGDAIPTRYGAVQVQLVLRGARILDVVVLKHPDDLERSREIDADALPKLRQQALAAQGAGIDGVAGATYTSRGYRQSVQSALDLA